MWPRGPALASMCEALDSIPALEGEYHPRISAASSLFFSPHVFFSCFKKNCFNVSSLLHEKNKKKKPQTHSSPQADIPFGLALARTFQTAGLSLSEVIETQ